MIKGQKTCLYGSAFCLTTQTSKAYLFLMKKWGKNFCYSFLFYTKCGVCLLLKGPFAVKHPKKYPNIS